MRESYLVAGPAGRVGNHLYLDVIFTGLPDDALQGMIFRIIFIHVPVDGVKLDYKPGDNKGSDRVFLTVIQADGSFKPVTSLAQPNG